MKYNLTAEPKIYFRVVNDPADFKAIQSNVCFNVEKEKDGQTSRQDELTAVGVDVFMNYNCYCTAVAPLLISNITNVVKVSSFVRELCCGQGVLRRRS